MRTGQGSRLRRLASVAALVAALAAAPAHADGFDYLGDGAPVYVTARPVALVGALQRLGVDQLPAVQRLRRQLGGIDPFNPAILAAPGIDVAAPLSAELLAPAGRNRMHSRVVATLRDPATFATFLDAVAASGQVALARVAPESALGRLGVRATGSPAPDTTLIVRVRGDTAVLDVVNTSDDKKAPSPAEVARRNPWKARRPFVATHGARRLFAPDTAAVVYLDGRRLGPLMQAIEAGDQRQRARLATPDARKRMLAAARARDKKCAVWRRAPALFDGVALALSAAPDGLSATLAWGTQSGKPLGGLALAALDDGGLDADTMGRDATAVLAVYAASLKPFVALARRGPFANAAALQHAIDGCAEKAALELAVRSWPLAVGALASPSPSAPGPLAMLQQGFGTLRNWVVALRDLTQGGPRFAVNATFDAAARPMLEMLLASAGAGAPGSFGKRTPTIYTMTLPGLAQPAAAALESLSGGRVGFTVAESEDSLRWAFKSGDAPAPTTPTPAATAHPPLARIIADLTAVAKLGPLFNVSQNAQATLDALARLRHVDGELLTDGDLFRLTLHAPLRN